MIVIRRRRRRRFKQILTRREARPPVVLEHIVSPTIGLHEIQRRLNHAVGIIDKPEGRFLRAFLSIWHAQHFRGPIQGREVGWPGSLRGARLAGIPSSRQPLHRSLRIPDPREIGFPPSARWRREKPALSGRSRSSRTPNSSRTPRGQLDRDDVQAIDDRPSKIALSMPMLPSRLDPAALNQRLGHSKIRVINKIPLVHQFLETKSCARESFLPTWPRRLRRHAQLETYFSALNSPSAWKSAPVT